MADEDHAVIAVEDFRREVQLVLARQIDRVAGAFRPAEEVAVIARPAGGGVFLGIAIGIGPFHVRIARGCSRRGVDLQRHAWRVLRQNCEATAERALGADHGRILVASGAGDCPDSGWSRPRCCRPSRCRWRRPAGTRPGLRPASGRTMNTWWQVTGLPVAVLCRQRDAISARRPVLTDAERMRDRPAATDDGALVGCVLPGGGKAVLRQDRGFGRAVAHDLQPVSGSGRADMQVDRRARRIGIGGRCSTRFRRVRRPCREFRNNGPEPPRGVALASARNRGTRFR